jgi:hypothetical protein
MRIVKVVAAFAAMLWTMPTLGQVAPQQVAAADQQTAARVAVVQRHVDAYRSGNLDRFMATFAPDAEVYGPGIAAVGREQIRASYRPNFAPGAPKIRVHSSEVAGDLVFLTIGYVSPSGEQLFCSYSEYGVAGDKIGYVASSMARCPDE